MDLKDKKTKVAVIILNWNGWKDTLECLESVFKSDYTDFNVIVVDNCSTDRSVEMIKKWAKGELTASGPDPEHPLFGLSSPPVKKPILYAEYKYLAEKREYLVTKENGILKSINDSESVESKCLILIRSNRNLGFAGGNNVGINYALKTNKFGYIFLLNNDAVITPSTLRILTNTLRENENLGFVMPVIYYYDSPNRIWNAGGVLTKWGGRRYLNAGRVDNGIYEGKKLVPISFVSGCALLVKSEILLKFGLLSEDFFFGEEDYEFSLRMKKHNVMGACLPEAHVYHKVSRSVQQFCPDKLKMAFIYHLNRFINLKKYYKRWYWNIWRFLALVYILPMLFLRYKAKPAQLVRYAIKLMTYSSKYKSVTYELFHEIKNSKEF